MKFRLVLLALLSVGFLFSCSQEKEVPSNSHLSASELAAKLEGSSNFQMTMAALNQRAEELAGKHQEALAQLSDSEWERYQELKRQYSTLEELQASGNEAEIVFVASLFPASHTRPEIFMIELKEELSGFTYDVADFNAAVSQASRSSEIQLSGTCLSVCNDVYIDQWVSTFNQYEDSGATEETCYAAAHAFGTVAFNSCMIGCNHPKVMG